MKVVNANHMAIGFLTAVLLQPHFQSAQAAPANQAAPPALKTAAANPADVRALCDSKRDTKACFQTGFNELRSKDPQQRRSAAKHLMLACTLQKKKRNCSKSEAKMAARNFLDRERIPAAVQATPVPVLSANGKPPIKAPKIKPTATTASNAPYTPPPGTFEPPPPQPPPVYEQPQPPPPMPEAMPPAAPYNPGMPGVTPDGFPIDPGQPQMQPPSQ